MDVLPPNYLYNFNIFANSVLFVCVVLLIWFGVKRMQGSKLERALFVGVLSGVLISWFAFALYMGNSNVYSSVNNLTIPTIQFGILIPIAVGLWLALRSQLMVNFIDAVPLTWLVGVQFYRVLGFMFLVLYFDGYLPWEFALAAGVGDIATGILALVVATMVVKDFGNTSRLVYAWCIFGIADLIIAVSLGAMSSPGILNLLSKDDPNLLITAFPLVMIPTFAVPLSIILHILTLWKLRRMRYTKAD